MNFKRVFNILLILSVLFTGWRAYKELNTYLKLDTIAAARVNSWEVVENSPSDYTLRANYFFTNGKKVYEDSSVFKKLRFLSESAAQSQISAYQKEKWTVFYSHKNPHFSSLQKLFPFKAMIHVVLALGIYLYFFWLQTIVQGRYAINKV